MNNFTPSFLDYYAGRELMMMATDLRLKHGANEFYSLIEAAMRFADTDNLEVLKSAWPNVWNDLQTRYNSPVGLLAEERTETFVKNLNERGIEIR